MSLEVGSRLGHHDVTALIGEGGMGQVYQATDTKLNRKLLTNGGVFMSNRWTVGLGVVAVTMALTTFALAQNVDWRLHNPDRAGSRYSEMDQIDRSNVQTLTPRWLFQHGVIDGVSNQTTPVVVDGVMFLTDSRGSVTRSTPPTDITCGHTT